MHLRVVRPVERRWGMKTFKIEYEIPPLRAIYNCECDADTEDEAVTQFAVEIPLGHIRKIDGQHKEHSIDCVHCRHRHGIRGDKGQRYAVVAEFQGETKTIGYTNDSTGGSLFRGATQWPACTDPRVIDRRPAESNPAPPDS